ncbi:hydrogenase expression/formation protein HypE [Pseudorhodoferax sp.]|uniref:hydrogenase expression/formation protein HypE n=1 Tax=Pseudorhodoferax sp. TaxID=1993553 RepID=UPI002DD69D45|nr:hydrogenase expression/formation protein HypE [Pseudorhodoferax sp.]
MSAPHNTYLRPLDFKRGRIDINHGAGGRASAQLVEELFARAFDNPALRAGDDGAVFEAPPGHRLVMATDGHVITPRVFPGGDIGCLSVHGTLNDVAMMGAVPLALSASFILEEGLPLAELRALVESMAAAARDAGVPIVTGDTKVVEQGKGDGVFIATTGIGALPPGRRIGGALARPGDALLLSGRIGDHGIAVLSQRESLGFEATVRSDTAALHGLVAALLAALPEGAVHTLRDPTRGGLATTLNEITRQSGTGMQIDEAAIPVHPEVTAACELLGLDPLYVANEGKLVAVVAAEQADAALAALRAHPLGVDAARIGSVVDDEHGFVQMRTTFGGRRVLDWLSGDPLPRIC